MSWSGCCSASTPGMSCCGSSARPTTRLGTSRSACWRWGHRPRGRPRPPAQTEAQPMAKRCSADALVRAVRRDKLDCDCAIEAHLNDNYQGRLAVPSLPKVWLALCSFNMGRHGRVLDLPDGPMSVGRVIEEFGLAPFLPLFDRQERAAF